LSKPRRIKIKFTIGFKLISLIALLLVFSIATLGSLSTHLFVQDNTALIQQMNADTASNLAEQIRVFFQSHSQKLQMISQILLQNNSKNLINEYDTVQIYDIKSKTTTAKMTSSHFENLGNSEAESFKEHLWNTLLLNNLALGEPQISTYRFSDESLSFLVALPLIQSGNSFSHIVVAAIPLKNIIKTFSENNLITSYLVDQTGSLLIHPNPTHFAIGDNLSQIGIVAEFLKGKFNNAQIKYQDPFSKESKLGAYKMVGFAGLAIISEVAEKKAFEAADRVRYRVTLLASIVICLAFLLGYLYSDSIVWPIQLLVKATQKVAQGNFQVKLKPKTNDELALLFNAFNSMTDGLIERDRIKDTFNKFHNKEIAEKLLSGEVKLGGEKREAVIFFSDIRDFTTLCETMKPEEVLDMLNEYMTKMVAVIRKHGGIVDKYVGDAIMAVWGVPLTKPNSEENALKACLEMRQELSTLNEIRISRNQPTLRIGMGLNMGEVIAGNVGSNEKMEYTILGDSVNLASRIESKTKEFGVDLLVSKALQEKLSEKFIFESCGSTKVKGKANEVELFKVNGYYDEQKTPVLVQTPYSQVSTENESSQPKEGLLDWEPKAA
jgi:adenylate cyclase